VSFASPYLLLLLLLVPAAAAAWLWLDGRRDERTARWSTPALLPNMASRPPRLRRVLPAALLLLGLALLLVGFARPTTHMRVKKQDATVVLVLDVSGSMAADDSRPTRIGAARRLANRYVDRLPKGYRMAVITFSDHSAVAVAPTHDLNAVRRALAHAHTGPQGTALADAVVRAVAVARRADGPQRGGKRPPAAVVLFSDGGETAGRLRPQQAAQLAARAHIPITAVAVGTPEGVVKQPVQGGYTERIQVPVEPQTLQAVARASGGTYVPGVRAADVGRTYAELGSRVGHTRKRVEVTSAAAAGGVLFMLFGGLLSGVWFRRIV